MKNTRGFEKNKIDHMTYLPDMEVLKSDIMDKVLKAVKTITIIAIQNQTFYML